MGDMTVTMGKRGATVTGLRDLPGWSVEFPHESNAVVLYPPEGETVSATAWRKVPIGACLTIAQAARELDVPRTLAALMAASGVEPERSSRSGPEAHLRRVAAVYRLALENDLWAPELLADVFGAKIPTTHRWIANAQRRGILGSHAEEAAKYTRPSVTVVTTDEAAVQARLNALLLEAEEAAGGPTPSPDRSGRVHSRISTTASHTSTEGA